MRTTLAARVSVLVQTGVLAAAAGRGSPDVPTKGVPPQPPAGAAPKVEVPSQKKLMAAKLEHAQAVLEGLALNDLKKVKASADRLVAISDAAEFLNAYKSNEYTLQINLFRRAAQTISRKAEAGNTDGVMLAYTDMTMTCLKCHQHTRDLR
jgi:hypothetical protein